LCGAAGATRRAPDVAVATRGDDPLWIGRKFVTNGADEMLEGHEWLTRQIVDREPSGIRFYMDIGLLESGPTRNDGPSMLVTNRHMRDVLRAKGYSVTYRELESCHEYVSWRGTLADGLIALIGEE